MAMSHIFIDPLLVELITHKTGHNLKQFYDDFFIFFPSYQKDLKQSYKLKKRRDLHILCGCLWWWWFENGFTEQGLGAGRATTMILK